MYLGAGFTVNQGELDNALTDYERSDPARSDGRRSFPRPCRCLPEAGRTGEGFGRLQGVDSARSDQRLGPPCLGRHLPRRRGFRSGSRHLGEAVRIAPQYSVAYRDRGDFYKDRGDFEKALADYNEAVRLAPTDPGLYLGRGDFSENRGETRQGSGRLQRSNPARPERPPGPTLSGPAYISPKAILTKPWSTTTKRSALSRRTATGMVSGVPSISTIASLRKQQRTSIGPRNSAPISWHHYKRRALAHFRLKHYDKVLESIAKAVELNPGDGSNLWWIPPVQVAKCPDERLRQGLLELADKAIERTKGAAESYAARAMLYEAFGRRDEAHADFDKALQLEPTNSVNVGLADINSRGSRTVGRGDRRLVQVRRVRTGASGLAVSARPGTAGWWAGWTSTASTAPRCSTASVRRKTPGTAIWTVWACATRHQTL